VEQWRFLDSGEGNGFWNMAIDEAIFAFTGKKNSLPTLRFYQWKPAAVSIGYSQDINEELNLEECRRLKIDVVRRWTGGGAIFHQDELTYSFTSKTDAFKGFNNFITSYYRVCAGIIKGLSRLGIQAGFRERGDSFLNKGIPCFMANSKHDLIADRKKLVGNAQRRTKEVFLQQGSLPIAYDFGLINKLFPQSDGFGDVASSISEILDRRIPLKEIRQKLLSGFVDNFSVSFKEDSLSSEELTMAQKLFKEKYSSPEWTFNKKVRKT